MSLFKLRGPLTRKQTLFLAFLGMGFILLIWYLLTMGDDPVLRSIVLPKPYKVLTSYADLYNDNNLIKNICLSVGRNLWGYLEAIALALPLGFIIGLFPFFRGSFQLSVDAIRFLPLAAVTVLFIAAFGVGTQMKVHFLAFGILIYILPVVAQRINEVSEVYLKTVYTLGASTWQTIKTVYIPSVVSRLSDDIRVLTAISWTYIIFAENQGAQGGIGALIWQAGLRQGRSDKVFAILIIIMLLGVLQDKVFVKLDKEFFGFKYQSKEAYRKKYYKPPSTMEMVGDFVVDILLWLLLGIYVLLAINEFTSLLGDARVLTYLFEDTVWVVHFIALGVIAYRGNTIFKQWKKNKKKK